MIPKKILFTLVILTSIATLGCVSQVYPYYGTAHLEPGQHAYMGLAFSSSGLNSAGTRADLLGERSICKYLKWYFRGSLGLGYVDLPGMSYGGPLPMLDMGSGLQTAVDLGYVTPALAVELSSYQGASIATSLLVGISNGERELVTLGATHHLILPHLSTIDYVPVDIFLSIHPGERFSIFAGAEIFSFSSNLPWITAGVGYRLNK